MSFKRELYFLLKAPNLSWNVYLERAWRQRRETNRKLYWVTNGRDSFYERLMWRPSFLPETELFENRLIMQDDAFVIQSILEVIWMSSRLMF